MVRKEGCVKLVLSGAYTRGKQIQIPIQGQDRSGGGWIDINVCWPGGGKNDPGQLIAQKIAEILRERGEQSWEVPSKFRKPSKLRGQRPR